MMNPFLKMHNFFKGFPCILSMYLFAWRCSLNNNNLLTQSVIINSFVDWYLDWFVRFRALNVLEQCLFKSWNQSHSSWGTFLLPCSTKVDQRIHRRNVWYFCSRTSVGDVRNSDRGHCLLSHRCAAAAGSLTYIMNVQGHKDKRRNDSMQNRCILFFLRLL